MCQNMNLDPIITIIATIYIYKLVQLSNRFIASSLITNSHLIRFILLQGRSMWHLPDARALIDPNFFIYISI